MSFFSSAWLHPNPFRSSYTSSPEMRPLVASLTKNARLHACIEGGDKAKNRKNLQEKEKKKRTEKKNTRLRRIPTYLLTRILHLVT